MSDHRGLSSVTEIASACAACTHPWAKCLGEIAPGAANFRWCSACGAMAFGEAWIAPVFHDLLLSCAQKGNC